MKLHFECDLPDDALWNLAIDGRMTIGVAVGQGACVVLPDCSRHLVKFKITTEEGDVKWQSQ